MEHSEFIQKTGKPGFLWGVKGFYSPVVRLWGVTRALPILLGAFVIFLPTVITFFYFLHAGKYLSLIWLSVSLFGFITGHPGINAIEGSFYFLIALAGLILGMIFGIHHLIGGIIPIVTWFAVGALKGTTMVDMEEELKGSEDMYKRFRDDGTLFFLDG